MSCTTENTIVKKQEESLVFTCEYLENHGSTSGTFTEASFILAAGIYPTQQLTLDFNAFCSGNMSVSAEFSIIHAIATIKRI